MDISVIIPIYNVEKYIERCLYSLFTQTKTAGVEFILINDATSCKSMEMTRRIISENSNLNIRIINNDKNLGIGATRQIGISAAIGEYIIQIDSDDWCEPAMLEKLYNKAKECDADIVCCDYYLNYRNKEIYAPQNIGKSTIESIELLIKGTLFGAMWNKLVKSSLYRDNKITFTPNLNNQEDLIVSLKLFNSAKNITYLPQAFLHYRQRKESMINISHLKRVQDNIKVIDEIETYFRGTSIEEKVNGALINRKISVKYTFMIATKAKERALNLKIYPEVDDKIGECELNYRLKLALKLTIKQNFFFADTIILFNRFVTLIKSTVKKILLRGRIVQYY